MHINNLANKTYERISELYPLLRYNSNLSTITTLELYMALITTVMRHNFEARPLHTNLKLKKSGERRLIFEDDFEIPEENKC